MNQAEIVKLLRDAPDMTEAYATVKANRALAEVQRRSSSQRRYNEAVDYYKSLVARPSGEDR